MSTTRSPARDADALQQRIALIACGTRPDKTQPCPGHRAQAAALLNIASTGAADALAAAICGTGRSPACHDCTTKATEIIRTYNAEPS
ncbi:hypothetical protein [Streptomyces similanensis]|uniref:(2Fe-2S)-binding protein n=1 Tax=Streptomyces similanensis TaxID=1274988 RepID=A0ABP9L837_9ACTN